MDQRSPRPGKTADHFPHDDGMIAHVLKRMTAAFEVGESSFDEWDSRLFSWAESNTFEPIDIRLGEPPGDRGLLGVENADAEKRGFDDRIVDTRALVDAHEDERRL